ncbi:hypothetical protein [Jiangella alkaliphila]|uniref:MYXO-CTERM domain-containing protein n=1 Tax=Jiangella alkaliphila TaxID=419479 RepID=A0A1H2JQV1_9ACTN|nr:hypothetical protein [Jiangella alkaliphila]SDU58538.1 hypothetical protein SAMN04488563_2951 [Jiangella alkaliphila]
MDTVVLLAEEAHSSSEGFPAWAWGLSAFGILLLLLYIVLSFGRGRPHA